jgi:hypothetical protein
MISTLPSRLKFSMAIAIPDCFVGTNLKLSNGRNGHGERRVYTGDSYDDNEKLTQKPWHMKYPVNYMEEIEPILNNATIFAKEMQNRKEFVETAFTAVKDKSIYVKSQNGTKDVRRYYVGPQKDNMENVKLWDTFRNTLIPKEYYLQLVEFENHFECQVKSNKTNPPTTNKKNVSVSNTQMEYFNYKQKEFGIEIQGGHNNQKEFELRNPDNGYYWPVDGRHECGIHKCSGSKDSPCPYNMCIWEFQGDYYHGNPEKYSKDDKFHNVSVETKWEKDKKKKEFYESQGYKVNIVWESEWITQKKFLQSEGRTWRMV